MESQNSLKQIIYTFTWKVKMSADVKAQALISEQLTNTIDKRSTVSQAVRWGLMCRSWSLLSQIKHVTTFNSIKSKLEVKSNTIDTEKTKE